MPAPEWFPAQYIWIITLSVRRSLRERFEGLRVTSVDTRASCDVEAGRDQIASVINEHIPMVPGETSERVSITVRPWCVAARRADL